MRYSALHEHIRRKQGPARAHLCACGRQATAWAYDGTDPNELTDVDHGKTVTYSGDVERYKPMCGSCHARLDRSRRPRTVCRKGHAYTPDNIYLTRAGVRRCRRCCLDVAKRYQQRLRAAADGEV